MTTARARGRLRRRSLRGGGQAGLAVASCLTVTALVAACGSSASDAAAVKKACAQVSAVLSDGPDPDADPAGYAEAQILPLRQIHPPDQSFKTAVSRLDHAYRQLFASNGKSAAATKAVAAASKRVNAICPGAAS
jgi:hypothetical protein